MNIFELNHSVVGHPKRKRVGRGAASGLGKTSGRGNKGMGSRTGANYLRNFVGGQTQLKARFAKRGFNNKVFATMYVPVNLSWLDSAFEAGAEVTPESINEGGMNVRRGDLLKILGTGEISKALTIKAHAVSKSALAKIEKAGGKVEILPGPATVKAEKLEAAAEKKNKTESKKK